MFQRLTNLARKFAAGRPKVGITPADVVHRENKWRLLHYRPDPEAQPLEQSPILLVPSLINRHYILDLMPGKSLTEYLLAQGHDVYTIDWGTPAAEDRYLTFDDICHTYLGRAVRKVARRSPTGKTHLLGYCLGGTLTTIYAAAEGAHLDTMALLAAPVDFADDGLLSTWSRLDTLDIGAVVKAFGNVPWQLMQIGFHLLRPTMNLSKAVYVLDKAWDDLFLDGFFALETWSNDNISFPGEAFRRYIVDLYQENKLIRGQFALAGKPVQLSTIDCPVMTVTFEHDHIVPPDSARALIDHVDDKLMTHVHLYGGHVGAVVSRKASKHLWPTLSDWFADQDRAADHQDIPAAQPVERAS